MSYRFETLQLHVGQEQPDVATDARAVPIYQTTSYVFRNAQHAADRFGLADAGNIYGRLTNSTQDVLEKRIATLEGGIAALALSSGAAAITYTIQALAANGGHIVSQKSIYGGSYNLLSNTLPLYGITTTFVDIHNVEDVEAAIRENTRAIFIETLGNPNSDIPDIDAIAQIAHKHGLPLVIDNTFATPYLVRPFEHGADIVVHSATKFLGGHGTTLGGVIVDSGTFDWKASGKFSHIADSVWAWVCSGFGVGTGSGMVHPHLILNGDGFRGRQILNRHIGAVYPGGGDGHGCNLDQALKGTRADLNPLDTIPGDGMGIGPIYPASFHHTVGGEAESGRTMQEEVPNQNG